MKAMIIAGAIPQIELIKQLKARGIYTVLADGSENCLARPYADVFYHIPIFDIDEVKKVAEKENVDFLITVCADQVLLVVAQVSEMLGLPCYIDYETAQNVSDKLKMKRIFKENGIPTSDFVEMNDFDANAINKLSFPLVVKPIDAYSSKGVRKAENMAELEEYYQDAKGFSRSGGVIVEEFCQGEEISVDAFVKDGKATILCVSNSDKIRDEGRFVIYRGRCPVSASPEIMKQIETVAQQIADAFGLKNAPLLIQMINDGKNISVLEFCARTGGNMKWLLVKYFCGVDVISAAIDITLGKEPDLTIKDTGNKYIINDFVYCNQGTFDHIEGYEALQAEGIINECFALRPKGMKVMGIRSSSDRIAGFNITAKSLEEFNLKHRIAVNAIKVLDDNGNDMMRRDLLPDLE